MSILKGTAGTLAASVLLLAASGCSGPREEDSMSKSQESDRDGRAEEPAVLETATFAAGCFWGVEATFRHVDGVTDTAAGYSGGTTRGPTYKDVCTGRTGHAEVVRVTYDPSRVSYERLLEAFWGCHDPTTRDRQGPDVGSQYRSAIFFHGPEQEAAAKASKEKLDRSGKFARPIVTEITAAGEFYRAEEYHQRYLEKKRISTCPSSGP